MDVDPTQTSTMQLVGSDEAQDLLVLHEGHVRECFKQAQYFRPARQRTARQFTEHERMNPDLHFLQQVRQPRAAATKMVDPDRSIDQHRWLLSDAATPPRYLREARLATPQQGQAPRALERDERFEACPNDGGLFREATQLARLLKQFVIDD